MNEQAPTSGTPSPERQRLAFLLETTELQAVHLEGRPFILSPSALAEAVQAAHEAVPMLSAFVRACSAHSLHRHLV